MHFSLLQSTFHTAAFNFKFCLHFTSLSCVIVFLFYSSAQSISSHSLCLSYCSCNSKSFFVNCSGLNLSSLMVFLPHDTEFLDLSGCSLQTVPQLNNLWRLHTLILAQNQIPDAGIRTWIGMQSLQVLDLSANTISELSESFSWGLETLTHLIIAENVLHTLHKLSFQYLHNLEYLDLRGNLISSLESRVLRSLTKLHCLQLQNNLLTSLQSDSFTVLQQLELLDLSGNQISDLPPGVFTPLHSLTFLNLQYNQLHHLRFQTLCSLPAPGTILLLSHNPWECDCDLQRVFGKLGGVQRLSLQDSEDLRCANPPPLKGRPLTSLDTTLCVAETVTVLVITLTVAVTVIGAIVTAERSRKKYPRTHEHDMCSQD